MTVPTRSVDSDSRRKTVKKRKLKSTKKVAVFLLLMAVWMASSFVWLQSYFADLTMDKLIFQMRVPMTGTNSDIIWNYLLYAVPPYGPSALAPSEKAGADL